MRPSSELLPAEAATSCMARQGRARQGSVSAGEGFRDDRVTHLRVGESGAQSGLVLVRSLVRRQDGTLVAGGPATVVVPWRIAQSVGDRHSMVRSLGQTRGRRADGVVPAWPR